MIKKVKKIIASAAAVAVSMFAASVALAANLNYSANTNLSINGNTYVILSGSAATTVVVGATTATITVPSGSALTLRSNDRYLLTNNSGVAQNCTASYNEIEIIGAVVSTAVVVTPSATLCSVSGGGGGGGGGGGSPTPPTPAPTPTPPVTTPAPPPAQTPAGTAPTDLSTRFALVGGVIYDKTTNTGFATPAAFFAASGVTGFNNLKFDTTYTPPSGAAAPASSPAFATALKVGQTKGDGIQALQQFLNTHGFVLANEGPGSPGNETKFLGSATKKALKAFQKSSGLKQTGTLDKATLNYLKAQGY